MNEQISYGDVAAWVALAAAILSPVITITIDKAFLYLTKMSDAKQKKDEAIAALISEILRASCSEPGKPPVLSSEAGKAIAYCSEKTAKYVVAYFTLWPDSQNAYRPSETSMHIFDKEDAPEIFGHATIRTTTQKLIEILMKESGCKTARRQ